MMISRHSTAIQAILVAGVISCMISGAPLYAEVSEKSVECAIQRGPCVAQMAHDLEIVLDILPRPVRAMSELTFRVTLKQHGIGVSDAKVVLDLTMPGMFMGKNEVVLKHIRNGLYEGTGVIIRCASNRKDWLASVNITRQIKKKTTARFLFEVQ